MATKQANTPRALNIFLKHLGKNKMGQSFLKLISESLQKKTGQQASQRKFTSLDYKNIFKSKSKDHNDLSLKKLIKPNQTVMSFKLNEGALGNSVRLMEVKPINLQQKGSIMNRVRNVTQINRSHRMNTLVFDKNIILVQQFLKKRQQLLKINKLDIILSTLTGNNNIAKLRIYKDKMKKFYNLRYVREKLTSFFDYEYIEDYDSQLRLLQTLLSLTLQQIHLLCFITLDINCDGLICNDDLFFISTQNYNSLLSNDTYKIFNYISIYQNQFNNFVISDGTTDDDPVRDINLTLQKYRMFVIKEQKEKLKNGPASSSKNEKSSLKKSMNMTFNNDKKGVILSRKINRHLFSLHHEEQQGKAAIKQLRKKFADYSLESRSNFKFKINFQRFQIIFQNIIPDTYLDILYMQGGIKVASKQYSPYNFNVDEIQVKDEVKMEIDQYSYFRDKISRMRETNRSSRIERFNSHRYHLNKSTSI